MKQDTHRIVLPIQDSETLSALLRNNDDSVEAVFSMTLIVDLSDLLINVNGVKQLRDMNQALQLMMCANYYGFTDLLDKLANQVVSLVEKEEDEL